MKKEIPLLFGSPKDKALFDPEHFLSSLNIKHPKADIAVIYFSSKVDKLVKEKLKIEPIKRNYEKMQFAHKKINGKEKLKICELCR
jgi:16S rRNA C1402 N4-methylase RsmH